MSAAHAAQRKRIFLDTDDLTRLNERIADRRRVQDQAREELAAAQAKYDVICAELQDLDGRHRVLSRSLKTVRASHRRAIWMTVIPSEILREIFLALDAFRHDRCDTPGQGRYNDERALRPFDLTGVCSRWRQLVLATPSLWSYISVDETETTDDGDMREIDLVHIELLLKRSQSAPLDVTLLWHHDSHHVMVNLRTALAQIAKHVVRLRRVELWLPQGITREPTMDMFKAPTPLLTHLFVLIASAAQLSDTFIENYFPHVPQLCFLELWGIGMSRSPRNPSFTCLKTLKLSWNVPAAQTMRLISMAAGTLEELWLDTRATVFDTNDLPVPLSHLTSLAVHAGYGVLSRITTPNLRRLALECGELDPSISWFLRQVSKTVTELTLEGTTIGSDHLSVILELSNIERLSFASTGTDDYRVTDAFFARLADTLPPIWPKLQSISLSSHGRYIPPDGDGLIRLVRARNIDSGSTDGDGIPCSLTEVDVRYKEVPDWIKATLENLF